MKKLSLIAATGLAALFMGACGNAEIDDSVVPVRGTKNISIGATVSGYTRATDTAFENNDHIGLYVLTPEAYLSNAEFVFTDAELRPVEEYKWYEDENIASTLIGYYPYAADRVFDDNTFEFTVNADQSTHALYTASDLMIANVTAKPTDETVSLPFRHVLSKIVVTVENKTDDKITDVYVADLYGTVSINALNAENNRVEGKHGTIKAASVSEPTGAQKWILITVPQGTMPKLIVTTESMKQYTYQLKESVVFQSGKQYPVTITLDDESISTEFTSDITDWTSDNDLNFIQPEVWTVIGQIGAIQDLYWTDLPMYKYEDGIWRASIHLYEQAPFKIRCTNYWDDIHNRGGEQIAVGEPFAAIAGGLDILNVGRAGEYEILYDPTAETIATFNCGPEQWSVIGSFGEAAWNTEIPMTYTDQRWTVEVIFDTDNTEFKLRGDGNWNFNRGGLLRSDGTYSAYLDGLNIIVPEAGKYTITYDPVAEIITLTDNSWKSLGTGMYIDDIMTVFREFVPTEYEVEIEESIMTPGRYRIVNPYGETWPYYGKVVGHQQGELIINAVNPNKVYIENSSIGVYSNGRGNFFTKSLCPENGWSDTRYGILNNGVIRLGIQNSMLIYFDGDDNSYYAGRQGYATITLPGYTRPKEFYGFNSLSYEGSELDDSGASTAKFIVDSRFDNTFVKIAVLDGVVSTADIEAKVKELVAGTIPSQDTGITGYGLFITKVPIANSGTYTAIVYTVDEAGNTWWFYRQFGYTVVGENTPENDLTLGEPTLSTSSPENHISFNIHCTDALHARIAIVKSSALAEAQVTEDQYASFVIENGAIYNSDSFRRLIGRPEGYSLGFNDLEAATSYTVIVYTKTLYGSEATKWATVTTGAAPEWTKLEGKGTFSDNTQFFGGWQNYRYAEVDIYQVSTGAEKYRVIAPYASYWTSAADQTNYLGSSADYLEFYAEPTDTTVYIHFKPFMTGYKELEHSDGNALVAQESASNSLSYSGYNVRKSEGVYQLAPLYIIDGTTAGWMYDRSSEIIIITLPGYTFEFTPEEPATAPLKVAPARDGGMNVFNKVDKFNRNRSITIGKVSSTRVESTDAMKFNSELKPIE